MTTIPASTISLSIVARIGRAMQKNQRTIQIVQWAVVAAYLFLLLAPLLLPIPEENAHIASNLRLLAQFLLWGIGWPLIMLSMMLFGRVWCGIFCPDGTLTELVSRHGQKRSIPRWIRWSGWPFTMLALTTIYGQLVGVYEFHPATILLLGLPTAGAILTGFLYGNGKRIWCMYLCPANGVFSLLAKISPLHFRVNSDKWKQNQSTLPRIDCPTLIDLRLMKSTSTCHACGRCSGYLDAVELSVRAPDCEILKGSNKTVSTAEAITLIFGILGIGSTAILWSRNNWFDALKSFLTVHGFAALEQYNAPWWLLANYPDSHAGFSLLDGICILTYLLAGGAFLGLVILALVWFATRITADPALSWQRLSLALIPIAGIGIFLGLSEFTVVHLNAAGISLPLVPQLQASLLATGGLFSGWLGIKLIVRQFIFQRLLALAVYLLPVGLMCLIWTDKYFA